MSGDIHIPDDIKPKDYFEKILTNLFEKAKSEHPLEGMEGTEFGMQLNISGPNGGTWSLLVKDAMEMKVWEGPYDKAQITIEMKESYWRDVVTEKVDIGTGIDKQLSPEVAKSQYRTLQTLKGKLVTRLTNPDGSILKSSVIFNKCELPETKIKMTVKDYVDLTDGSLDGRTAFLEGKIEIEGDILLALKLSRIQF